MEEGLLPIRQAKTDEQVAEERRLLYVGITRARTHLALSWSQKPSRFVDEIRPRTITHDPVRRSARPPAPRPHPAHCSKRFSCGAANAPRRTPCPRTSIAHDSMLEAIADDRPTSMSQLRRVKGMGPVKLDQYGAEILAICAASPPRSGLRVR